MAIIYMNAEDRLNSKAPIAIGETAQDADTGKFYKYNESKEWEEVQIKIEGDSNLVTMTLYEMNQQIMTQLADMSIEAVTEKIKAIESDILALEDKYFMLLNNEFNYYTLFVKDKYSVETFTEIMLICLLESFGKASVKSIEAVPAQVGCYEIWLKLEAQEEGICFYLFPCEKMVEPFGG